MWWIVFRSIFGQAKVLFDELISRTNDNEQNEDARIDVVLNHIEIYGNLRCAADEAQDYPDLYYALLDAERAYRYEGLEPDWQELTSLMIKAQKEAQI